MFFRKDFNGKLYFWCVNALYYIVIWYYIFWWNVLTDIYWYKTPTFYSHSINKDIWINFLILQFKFKKLRSINIWFKDPFVWNSNKFNKCYNLLHSVSLTFWYAMSTDVYTPYMLCLHMSTQRICYVYTCLYSVYAMSTHVYTAYMLYLHMSTQRIGIASKPCLCRLCIPLLSNLLLYCWRPGNQNTFFPDLVRCSQYRLGTMVGSYCLDLTLKHNTTCQGSCWRNWSLVWFLSRSRPRSNLGTRKQRKNT